MTFPDSTVSSIPFTEGIEVYSFRKFRILKLADNEFHESKFPDFGNFAAFSLDKIEGNHTKTIFGNRNVIIFRVKIDEIHHFSYDDSSKVNQNFDQPAETINKPSYGFDRFFPVFPRLFQHSYVKGHPVRLQIDDYAKDGGPGAVWTSCSLNHNPLQP